MLNATLISLSTMRFYSSLNPNQRELFPPWPFSKHPDLTCEKSCFANPPSHRPHLARGLIASINARSGEEEEKKHRGNRCLRAGCARINDQGSALGFCLHQVINGVEWSRRSCRQSGSSKAGRAETNLFSFFNKTENTLLPSRQGETLWGTEVNGKGFYSV